MTQCRTGGEGRIRLGLGRLLAVALSRMYPGSQNSPEKCQKATWDRLSLQQLVAPVPPVPFATGAAQSCSLQAPALCSRGSGSECRWQHHVTEG